MKKTKKLDFDVDEFYENVKFKDLKLLSPMFNHMRLPSVYNDNRSHIYLSSQDLIVDTNDEAELRSILQLCKECFFQNRERNNLCKAFCNYIDFVEICSLLDNLTGQCDFSDPEEILFSLNKRQ